MARKACCWGAVSYRPLGMRMAHYTPCAHHLQWWLISTKVLCLLHCSVPTVLITPTPPQSHVPVPRDPVDCLAWRSVWTWSVFWNNVWGRESVKEYSYVREMFQYWSKEEVQKHVLFLLFIRHQSRGELLRFLSGIKVISYVCRWIIAGLYKVGLADTRYIQFNHTYFYQSAVLTNSFYHFHSLDSCPAKFLLSGFLSLNGFYTDRGLNWHLLL